MVRLDRHAVFGDDCTGISLWRAISSSIRLRKSGDRCWTTTNAMPVSRGQRGEQLLERLEAAGGGADAYDPLCWFHAGRIFKT